MCPCVHTNSASVSLAALAACSSRAAAGVSMEPRPYQAEAFDAARKSNVVMVGATGVGKVRHDTAVYI